MTILDELGLRPVINADAMLTRLGGTRMPAVVLDAMREASAAYVDMFELQQAVGTRLAALTRNEAAFVTSGAASGLVLTTLAAMNDGDIATIARSLEGERPLKHRIIMQRCQRIPYDVVTRLAGAEIVEIGNAIQTFGWELEAAIDERTAMVLYIAGSHLQKAALPLEEVVAIAHARNVPVVVDAAAQLPPASNLWRFTAEAGADAAIFSGGKELHGPQASGLVVGSAAFLAKLAENASPHQRLARPMKVGKEEMIGLLAAVQWFLERDLPAREAALERQVAGWVERWQGIPGVRAFRIYPDEAGQPTPRVGFRFDSNVTGLTGPEIRQQLWDGDPRIHVAPLGRDGLSISFNPLDDDDDAVIQRRLSEILATVGAVSR